MYSREESYDTAWLKAERDLATSGYVLPLDSLATPSSEDDILPILDEKILKHIQQNPNPTKLENYQPGANRDLVFDALKKVARTSKPCEKRTEQPDATS